MRRLRESESESGNWDLGVLLCVGLGRSEGRNSFNS